MNAYVLIREDGAYVAPPGQEHSYTRKLEAARTYPSRADAERDACGNERAAAVESLLSGEGRP